MPPKSHQKKSTPITTRSSSGSNTLSSVAKSPKKDDTSALDMNKMFQQILAKLNDVQLENQKQMQEQMNAVQSKNQQRMHEIKNDLIHHIETTMDDKLKGFDSHLEKIDNVLKLVKLISIPEFMNLITK